MDGKEENVNKTSIAKPLAPDFAELMVDQADTGMGPDSKMHNPHRL
jgi:hypothetical protein